jgi:hypothetical protein
MFSPKPKPSTTRDRATIEWVRDRRDGICMVGLRRPGIYGPCSGGLDPHHIVHKGAGGEDTKPNLITLCRRHHNLAHANKITKDELHAILTECFGYQYG